MNNLHNILGQRGEDLAADLLRQKGYTIRERNWKIGDLETDIIAQKGDTIVFVEVKTRSEGGFKRPEEAVDRERQIRLKAGAQAYIKHEKLDNPWRFDIIAIEMKAGSPEIEHIEDAFMPVLRAVSSRSFSGENRWKQSNKSTRAKGFKR